MQSQSKASRTLPVNPPTAIQAAWAAGFIDGEGTIRIQRKHLSNRPSPHFSLVVSVANRDEGAIRLLRDFFGGIVKFAPGKRPNEAAVYKWQIVERQAESALKTIEPYLLLKARHVQLAFTFQDCRRPRSNQLNKRWRGIPLTVEELDERERLYLAMRRLNGRGNNYVPA